MSPAAWQGFSLLRSLLDPFQRAMEGVMARTATVAEVARQWLRLAAALNAEAGALDPGPPPCCSSPVYYIANRPWSSDPDFGTLLHLAVLRGLVALLAPGGMLWYLDGEACPQAWAMSPVVKA